MHVHFETVVNEYFTEMHIEFNGIINVLPIYFSSN